MGEYLSNTQSEEVSILRTSEGTIIIPRETLIKQFEDPGLVSRKDLEKIAGTFKLNTI